MAETTPAEELRTAAATLRELAVEDELYTQTGGSDFGPMPPALARLVADWLDDAARGCDATVIAAKHVWPLDTDESEAFIREQAPASALAVARNINTSTEEPTR